MSTLINFINGSWKNVKNKCRTTVNKDYSDVEATPQFKQDMMISEHSPIRLLGIDWTWLKIPYWVSTEWSRHKFEKFISTQRTDRTGVDRGELPQGALVNFDGDANAQHTIDAWRKRMCRCATDEARELAEELKVQLHVVEPEWADVLVPNCVYRCGCPEFPNMTICKYWDGFVKRNPFVDMTNIRERYKVYNDEFYRNYYEKVVDKYSKT